MLLPELVCFKKLPERVIRGHPANAGLCKISGHVWRPSAGKEMSIPGDGAGRSSVAGVCPLARNKLVIPDSFRPQFFHDRPDFLEYGCQQQRHRLADIHLHDTTMEFLYVGEELIVFIIVDAYLIVVPVRYFTYFPAQKVEMFLMTLSVLQEEICVSGSRASRKLVDMNA